VATDVADIDSSYILAPVQEAKLFKNGQSQAVRLPKEFRFTGSSVYVRKLGDVVMLIPKRRSWNALIDACGRFTDDFMSSRDQGAHERDKPFE
jgi:antitoxin VapB